jgi:methionyl-tRNA synthetase
VLWPALLLAAGVPLPRQIYVHGFIYARGGKLSKSLGNSVDPVDLVTRFGPDALRYYLLASFPAGRDGEFTIEQFVEFVNVRLANELGNLASRTVTMVHKYFGGVAPAEWEPDALREPEARVALEALISAAAQAHVAVPAAYADLRLHEALEQAWQPVVRANEFIERVKPWTVAKDESRRAELATSLNALLEALRLVAIWAWPVVPGKSEALWTLLSLPGKPGETRGDAAAPHGSCRSTPFEFVGPRQHARARTARLTCAVRPPIVCSLRFATRPNPYHT